MGRKSRDAAPLRPGSGATRQSCAIFACTGEYWTIGPAGALFSVRHVKGLGYIQRLLQHPGEEFHALDVLGGCGPVAESDLIEKNESALAAGVSFRRGLQGDAGELLDERAKREYRRRLTDLKEDLTQSRERGDAAGADRIESEIEFLAGEISRAVGLGGRLRRAGSAAERARLNVTRAVRSALDKIAEQDSALGATLNRCIRTGSFCTYVPDPKTPISWQFVLKPDGTEIQTPQPQAVFTPKPTSFAPSYPAASVLVGRDSERAALLALLEQSRQGTGKLVLIDGAAGVGKTRMAAEIAAEASRRGFLTFAGGCYDRSDPVPFIPFVEILETAMARARNPSVFRDALGDDAAELSRLVPHLRRLFPDIPQPAELPPEQSRRLLFGAVAGILARLSLSAPVLCLLDDLHWADEGTLLLLNHLAQLIPGLPVMILGTYRTYEPDPGGQLIRTLDELIRERLIESFSLRGLPIDGVAGMLRALSGQQPPEPVVRLFYANTEGNPFFVEELFRHLSEQGRLLDEDGNFRRGLEMGEPDVPRNLRVVIRRRLARLNESTRKALGTAAVIRRSFTFDLLRAAAHTAADSLLDCVEEAERAGLITATLDYPQARFRFSHELIRQAVLSDLSAPRRQRLHLEAANAIEQLWSDTVEDHAEDLAHHLWNAGAGADPGKTLHYLQLAGERASQRSANLEAINHFRNGLTLAGGIARTPRLLRQEFMLNAALGTALVSTRGFSSLEVGRVFARARELSQQVQETPQLFRAFWGLWINYASRSEYAAGFEMGEQCLKLARSSGDSGLLVEAHHALGVSCCTAGEFAAGLGHLEQAIAIYNPVEHERLKFIYGQDPAVACLFHAGWALWFLGYPDQSIKRDEEGIELARRLNHPATMAMAAAFGALPYQFQRKAEAVERIAAEAVRLSNEYELAFYRCMGAILCGWALAQRGRVEEGSAQMRMGIEAFHSTDGVIMIPYFSTLLAQVYGHNGRPADGLRVLDSIECVDRYWVAEFSRVRGELLLQQAAGENEAAAEECFAQALAKSTEQSAKSLELRAAVSISRLRLKQGRAAEGRRLLAGVFDWFSEGFDTPDLREARALLENLHTGSNLVN